MQVLYSHLNRTLKLVDRTKLRPWFRYLKLFLTALAKLPPAPRQTVWRGVKKNHSDEYAPGTIVTWWAIFFLYNIIECSRIGSLFG